MRPVSWLYVPGDRPDRFARALASSAHVVIVDLEDAVHPEHKLAARREALALLADAPPGRVEVRVNPLGSPRGRDDLAALPAVTALRAARLPKIEQPADVTAALAGLDPGIRVSCLLESALGVEHAFAVASSDRRVLAIGLGESDLGGDLGVGADGLDFARSRTVLAARAAGLAAPAMSVYPRVADAEGLAASCAHGRRLGLLGRAAIHPDQLSVIHDSFRPGAGEITRAQEVLAELDGAAATGVGVSVRPDGRMIDPAMRRRAQDVLDLAAALAG
jgi:citrate lyase subunit beta / citryl-CoA lyase